MSEKARNFSSLKKEMNLFDFNSFCKKVAVEYANSEAEYSSSYFMKRENITESCFYKILEYAVISNLVNEEAVDKMQNKAVGNQKSHASNAGWTSVNHYVKLRKRRNEFIISLYLDQDIRNLAEDFAKSIEESKAEIAKRYEISVYVLDRLLLKAITENIITDEICNKIIERSLKARSSKRSEEFFKQILQIRNERRKSSE